MDLMTVASLVVLFIFWTVSVYLFGHGHGHRKGYIRGYNTGAKQILNEWKLFAGRSDTDQQDVIDDAEAHFGELKD